jgi:hypothetical protein
LQSFVAICVTALLLATGRAAADSPAADFDLQAKCADRAAIFFKQNKYDEMTGSQSAQGFFAYHENHWNKARSKCFIEIYVNSVSTNFSTIDIYDAVEGKHYGEFIGHLVCDSSITHDATLCMLDSGNIWLDGNDSRWPADFHFGWQGTSVGPGVGDERTRQQFIDRAHGLMSE